MLQSCQRERPTSDKISLRYYDGGLDAENMSYYYGHDDRRIVLKISTAEWEGDFVDLHETIFV